MEEGAKPTILIAEDEEVELEVLTSEFEKAGFNVSVARDGQEALDMAVSEESDIILLDILMPEMDGWEVMKKIRGEGEWGKDVPIIILSNTDVDTDEKQQQVAEDEPAYFLVKTDFTIDEVVTKAKEVLEQEG